MLHYKCLQQISTQMVCKEFGLVVISTGKRVGLMWVPDPVEIEAGM